MTSLTLREIKNTFNKKAGSNTFYYGSIVRPISYPLTYLVIKLGLQSPNKATMWGMLFGLISACCFILSATDERYLIGGALGYFLFNIFDVIDGNLARVFNKATYFGKFLDGFVDTIIEGAMIVGILGGAYLKYESSWYFYGSLLLTWFFLLAAVLMNRYSFTSRWMKSEVKAGSDASSYIFSSPKFPIKPTMNFLTDIRVYAILSAPAFAYSEIWVGVFALSVFLMSLLLWVVFGIDSYKVLNVPRLSKWDSRNK